MLLPDLMTFTGMLPMILIFSWKALVRSLSGPAESLSGPERTGLPGAEVKTLLPVIGVPPSRGECGGLTAVHVAAKELPACAVWLPGLSITGGT